MKKVVSFVLVLVTILSIGVTALAAPSPVVPPDRPPVTQPDVNIGLGICNKDDKTIAIVPGKDVKRILPTQADKLDPADKEAFLAAYEEAKNIKDKVVQDFFWLDIPDKYKNLADFGYAKLTFECKGDNVEVSVNGKPMEVVEQAENSYFAKITEFGSVCITSD